MGLRLTLVTLSVNVNFGQFIMRILFVASEALPFAKTGGLADVLEALPKALVKLGHEVAIFLPRYKGVKAAKTVQPSMTIPQPKYRTYMQTEWSSGTRVLLF